MTMSWAYREASQGLPVLEVLEVLEEEEEEEREARLALQQAPTTHALAPAHPQERRSEAAPAEVGMQWLVVDEMFEDAPHDP